MRQPFSVARRFGMCIAVTVWVSVVSASGLLAQGDTPGSTQPLPLSGRNSQAGSVTVTQTGGPGLTSISILSPSIQMQGAVLGSTGSTGSRPFSGVLTFLDAIQRGLDYNLAAVGLGQTVRQARAQQLIARSALLPNVVGTVADVEQQVNLAALGVRFNLPVPGFSLPTVVGPFNVVELRGRLSQTVIALPALNTHRAARETLRASEFAARDTRDLIVLAVGGAYLQAIAARARLRSAQAQVDTATTLYQRASQRRSAGLATPLDVNRAQVQLLTQKQRLISLQADFAKQKIGLARMTGLPPTDRYNIDDDVPLSASPSITLDQALQQAAERRADIKAAEAQVRAAERALAAAQAQRLPSVTVSADYGGILTGSTSMRGTFAVVAAVRVPIWEGGRAEGEIEQAQAALAQRRAELEDLKAQIEGDVRKAYLDLQSAATQVEVTEANVQVSTENLGLTRQAFDAGVGDNVAVVQSQELVAAAELDYVNSIFGHNLARLDLARAVGRASDAIPELLKLP